MTAASATAAGAMPRTRAGARGAATDTSAAGGASLSLTDPATLRSIAMYGALIMLAIGFVLPFAWSLLTSFKTQADASAGTILPTSLTLEGYRTAFGELPFGSYFLHSLGIAIAVTISNVALSALGGYAFARLRFPGSGLLFACVLGAMMVPDQARMVPVFQLLKALHLVDQYAGVWLLQAVQPFGLFLMRQHFLALPKELEEAARLDGAGPFTTFRKVMLPLTGPALATLTILTFQGAWNDFFWSLLVLHDPSRHTLPLGLALFTSAYETQWPPLMAATVVATLPVLALFIAFQKHFVGGQATAGVTG
jgi:multiple sugar transport system permease protein